MKIVHVSDTHTLHEKLIIPPCDVLIHSGDIGSRTNQQELTCFLAWLEAQPARHKIWIAGNHDICLDHAFMKNRHSNIWQVGVQLHSQAMALMAHYKVQYLHNEALEIEGHCFYGAPWSPSFHPDDWAFNQDRGVEIQKQWAKIPANVEILITHSPPYNILDEVPGLEKKYPGEEVHVGCLDLWEVVKTRLFSLKLHCFGHIHGNYGVVKKSISQKREALFSNGAVLDNNYSVRIDKPLIIEL